MKKGIIVLLIAVLASSFAFAAFSGSAGVRFDAYLGGDGAAFITSNAKSLDFTFTFASEEIKIDSSEDEIHVEVAASAKFILGKYKGDYVDMSDDGDLYLYTGNGIPVFASDVADRGIGAVVKLDTAKIVGKNWYVSVLGTQSAYDYAKAAVLQIKSKQNKDDFGNKTDKANQAASYAADYNKVPGVTVGFNGFTASAGFDYVKVKDAADDLKVFAASGSIETPEFAFNDDAVKVQAAAEFSRYGIAEGKAAIKGNTIGASAKATVAIQDITVGIAADMGLENLGAEIEGQTQKDTVFNFDARVDFKYNFVDASIYTYAGKNGLKFTDSVGDKTFKDFYLEAKAAFDLNAFELPLKVTVTAKNITNSELLLVGGNPAYGIVPGLKVEFAKDAIKAAASFELNTESKDWNVLAYGTYAFEKFTAGAGVKVAKDAAEELNVISFGAFAESDKIVKGATFGLSYGLSNDDCYSDGCAATLADGNFNSNFKDDPVSAGAMLAYCKIAF